VFLLLLALPTTAFGDSGGATINSLPESEEVEVAFEVQHECYSQSCVWAAYASAYSASTECPATFDSSHYVGSGNVETAGGNSTGRFSFAPALRTSSSEVIVCLYVESGSSTTLVGQSHPFNLITHREVLPQPAGPPARYPAKLSVWVHVLHRCEFIPHIRINGHGAVGGNIVWALYRVGRRHLLRLDGETSAAEDTFSAGGYPSGGTFRFVARFLGDENLLPSNGAASTTFHLKRC
jgi:hypothetical protein